MSNLVFINTAFNTRDRRRAMAAVSDHGNGTMIFLDTLTREWNVNVIRIAEPEDLYLIAPQYITADIPEIIREALLRGIRDVRAARGDSRVTTDGVQFGAMRSADDSGLAYADADLIRSWANGVRLARTEGMFASGGPISVSEHARSLMVDESMIPSRRLAGSELDRYIGQVAEDRAEGRMVEILIHGDIHPSLDEATRGMRRFGEATRNTTFTMTNDTPDEWWDEAPDVASVSAGIGRLGDVNSVEIEDRGGDIVAQVSVTRAQAHSIVRRMHEDRCSSAQLEHDDENRLMLTNMNDEEWLRASGNNPSGACPCSDCRAIRNETLQQRYPRPPGYQQECRCVYCRTYRMDHRTGLATILVGSTLPERNPNRVRVHFVVRQPVLEPLDIDWGRIDRDARITLDPRRRPADWAASRASRSTSPPQRVGRSENAREIVGVEPVPADWKPNGWEA